MSLGHLTDSDGKRLTIQLAMVRIAGDVRCTVLEHPSDDSLVQVKTYMMTRQPAVWFSLHDVLGDGAEDLGSAQHEKRGH
jgi:hypothetical protein